MSEPVKSFTCEECRELLSDYVDRELSEAERAGVERHLSTCEKCTKESTSLKGLKNIVAHWDGVSASPGFREKVVQEYIRESQMLPSRPFTEAAERAKEQSSRTAIPSNGNGKLTLLLLGLAGAGVLAALAWIYFSGHK